MQSRIIGHPSLSSQKPSKITHMFWRRSLFVLRLCLSLMKLSQVAEEWLPAFCCRRNIFCHRANSVTAAWPKSGSCGARR